MHPSIRWLCCMVITLGNIGDAPAAHTTVAVASNFIAAATRLGAAFGDTTNHRITFAFGATGLLYAQIHQGAPFDGLLAADQRTPQLLAEEGIAIASSRFTYARGRLVLWSMDARLIDQTAAILQGTNTTTLAIANPEIAPYGEASIAVLQALQIYDQWRDRLVLGNSISQTYLFVASGNVALGFIAASQLTGQGSSWLVPEHYHQPIKQQAVVLQHGATNTATRDFFIWLQSPPARAIIHSHGYATEPAQ